MKLSDLAIVTLMTVCLGTLTFFATKYAKASQPSSRNQVTPVGVYVDDERGIVCYVFAQGASCVKP